MTAFPLIERVRRLSEARWFFDSERADLHALADVAEQLQTALRACHEWIGGLPITPSFEDKRAMQAAIEGVLALAEKDAQCS